MIELMRAQIRSKGWERNVSAAVMNSQDLKFGDGTFNASVTNFGIFFFPDPVLGAREIRRTLKEGGTAVFTCARALPITRLYDAAEEIVRPAKPFNRPTVVETWKDPALLESTLREGKFEDVEMHSTEVWFWGTDLKDLCKALTENMLTFVGNDWTEDEKARLDGAMMEALLGFEGMKLIKSLDSEGEEWKGRMGVKCSAWIAVARK